MRKILKTTLTDDFLPKWAWKSTGPESVFFGWDGFDFRKTPGEAWS